MEGSKIDYSKLVSRSGDNEYFDFARFGLLSSFCLKFINGSVGINVAKLKLKEFKNEIDSLKRKKAKNQSYKANKNSVLQNAEALYNGLNIIVDAFEIRIFESKYRSEFDVDIHSTSGSDPYEFHCCTDKELKMFKNFFSCENPMELRQTLIETTDEKYNELLKDLDIKLAFLKDQINTNIGVSRTRLYNLVNAVEDILDSVRWCDNISDLESEESAAQRRNQPGRGLKILTPNQMVSRLPISLVQLKADNNSEKLKNEIR